MLTTQRIDDILERLPRLSIGVLGDLFLDRYLDIDARLTEPSVETGLDAYQVTAVRAAPGAAGTVVNNLVALGVGRVVPVAVIGDDGEGHELWQALQRLPAVALNHVRRMYRPDFRTPTYTKPMLHQPAQAPRELNRLDIKNRRPLPETEAFVQAALAAAWPRLDALLVVDQVSEAECGVVTTAVRRALADLGRRDPAKLILADSRARIGLFEAVALKPNHAECVRVAGGDVEELVRRCGRPVFCTLGERGVLVAAPGTAAVLVPAYPVRGPIDIVGAGDSTSAGIACAVASGATMAEAAAFGNLVASITIQQLGTTGTATPAQVRQRWREMTQAESR
jgi:bifunctional ADP-heptose synthase (sugar kinase/adenylyltransferase)